MFGLLSALFLAALAEFALGLAFFAQLLRGALVNNPDKPLLLRIQLADDDVNTVDLAEIWFGSGNNGLLVSLLSSHVCNML